MAEERTQKLCVRSQAPLRSWARKGGAQTTLYSLEAEDAEGLRVPDLRTFSELPKNELIEFKLKAYDHPEDGRTWTVQKPSGGLSKQLSEIEETVADLVTRVAQLEARLGEPEEERHPAQQSEAPRGPDWY